MKEVRSKKNKNKKKQEKWTSRNQAMFSLFPIFFVSYGFLHFIYKYMYNCTFLPTPAFQKQSEEIFVYPSIDICSMYILSICISICILSIKTSFQHQLF